MAAGRTLAIGDIHGHLGHFDALLDAVAPTAGDQLILLGDYVDRGPDSKGVIDRIIQLKKSLNVIAIQGNHEQMMAAARTDYRAFAEWVMNGGDRALRSYGGDRARLSDVPEAHWEFLERALVHYVETDTHIFVHASAQNDLEMAEQPDYMLRWERCDQVAPHQSGKVIVCGHTPQKSGRPMNKGYAVCIDTHVYGKAGLLTCLDAVSGQVVQADGQGRITRAHLTDFGDAD